MVRHVVFFVLLFYALVLLQASFLVNFTAWGYVPNLILIAVLLLNIFNSDIKLGVETALIGGFFLDIFSSNFFGFWVLILLAAALFIQLILKRYVQIPSIAKI